MQKNNHERQPVLVALVHGILNRETFATIADLSEATKREAARLRLPYDASQLTAAFDTVSRTRQLIDAPVRQRRERAEPESRQMSSAEARRILGVIADRLVP